MSQSATGRKPRVAFVVQRCGVEVNGGAELHCLQVAQRMAYHWDVEVLTTCAREYVQWDNFYPEGEEDVGGVLVRRFLVSESRDVLHFNRLSKKLQARGTSATIEEQEDWMRAQGPQCAALLEFIRSSHEQYDAFIFFGYLYATTYFGLQLVTGKAFLAPLAHDEWTIYLPMWERFFSLPRKLIFNTRVERDFLRRTFPGVRLDGPIIGVGVEAPVATKPSRFCERYGVRERFVVYVGRIDESKGCGVLFDYFIRARAEGAILQKLILIGAEVMPVPFHDDIIHLGFVSEKDKWDALAAADWLIMPSPHESLSIALLEAWSVGCVALVTATCDVLVRHCQESHGGLWYDGYKQFAVILTKFDDDTRRQLGSQGQAYVQENYAWPKVEADYLKLGGDF